ncbi:MAG TPA: ORF6N domain-containing protein [Thermoanaerobaculia bacterium]|nr:ORF6N domain-containing protein [Thermoanaerobaculia bacterium]
MGETQALMPAERIERVILVLRGEKVILDSEIALLYEVETKALVQAMKRNLDRFPRDFMFQLTREEVEFLRCQSGTSKGRGGRRYLPYAFTEQGVAMLSSVLSSERAVRVNIEIIRTFVRLRQVMTTQVDLVRRIDELEQRYDAQFKVVFDALRQLVKRPEATRKQIGFGGL